MATPAYVPILKGKEGEFAALEALTHDVRTALMPLIEVPAVPYDYTNERPARTLEDHLVSAAERLQRCWPDQPLLVDLPWLDEDEYMPDGRVALEAVLTDCQRLGVQAVPVVSRTTSDDAIGAACRHSQISGLGGCIRLRVDDFEEDVDIDAEVGRLVNGFGRTGSGSLDLIIDLEDLSHETSREVLVARSVFSMIPRRDDWRRVILAAASFPEDLSNVDASTVATLPRREWHVWKTLQRRPASLPRRDIIYADYAIAHPVPRELDPRTMRMSANIRYTTPDDWLIIKGRNVRQYGFEQYFDLCRALVQRPEYRGPGFSWGDTYIAECAEGISGPGNATTWRKVGTNHHLTLVVSELAPSPTPL